MKKIAIAYLKNNKKVDVIHATTDGNLFFNISDAKNHAKTLDDDAVETVHQEKKMVEAVNDLEVAEKEAAEKEAAEKEAAEKEAAKKEAAKKEAAEKEAAKKEAAEKEAAEKEAAEKEAAGKEAAEAAVKAAKKPVIKQDTKIK